MKSDIRTTVLVCALAVAAIFCTPRPTMAAEPFFLRDGDRIVVIGDSITVQGDYVRYLECFLRTRFPQWKIAVRNCGINGHTAQMGMPYLESDVLAWRPTVAIVNWGMNDGRREGGADYYRNGITAYVDRLLAQRVRVVLCSNSPIDIGDPPGTFTDFNKNFDEMARFAASLAREKGLPMVDQFHFCHELWGQNRRRDKPVPVSDQTLARHPSDYVHARAPGQLTMVYLILKTLHAPRDVSAASLDLAHGRWETERCGIRDFTRQDGVLSFVRTDEASCCWIDEVGAQAFALVPFQDELNRMTLQIRGLPEGRYEISIDDVAVGRFTAAQFAEGINLSLCGESPLWAVGREVDAGVRIQRGATAVLRESIRWQPPSWLKIPDLARQKAERFTAAQPALEKNDLAIAQAAEPQPHRYTIRPMP